MKKQSINKRVIITGAIALCLSLSFSSCKNFLEVPVPGKQTADQLTPTEALISSYNALYTGASGYRSSGLIMGSIASDDADNGSGGGDDVDNSTNNDNLLFFTNNTAYDNFWKDTRGGINRVNSTIPLIEASEEQDKDKMLGEARFLRAYFYFNLARAFGGVPLTTKLVDINNPNPADQARATEDETYQFIIDDLNFAVSSLPNKEDAIVGRITKGAALALLAKVYLYRGDYSKAEATANLVQGYGLLQIGDDYNVIFRTENNNSIESVFEIQTGVNSSCNAAVEGYVEFQGPRRRLGWGFNTPTQSLAAAFEPNDKRRAGTIIFVAPAGTTPTVLWDGERLARPEFLNDRYNYKAYHSQKMEPYCGNLGRAPKNVRVIRYAEVLLIRAEAAFQNGNTGKALDDINAIRKRAGLLEKTVITLQDIWKERRVEMAMENDRYFDLMRQDRVLPGTAEEAFNADGKPNKFKTHMRLFPIPESQINLSNGLLKQNPGY